MTSLVRFDPWGMVRDLDRLFEDSARRTGDRSWMPRVDVFEKDSNLVIRAEVPGVDPEHIDVTVESGTLAITAAAANISNSRNRRNAQQYRSVHDTVKRSSAL